MKIKTTVSAKLPDVRNGFTAELFMKLNPPFPPVKLEKFEGCQAGDQVALELNFILFKQKWVSDIIEDRQDQQRWFFVDQGKKLPFFLSKWRHHHEVSSSGSHSIIMDDITYSTGTLFTDLIMYPLLFGQFLYRRPIYKKIFNGK